ncbi:FxDxF family PEP-CTERM protein [Kinneretia asaccharophila]|uniref:Putative secreted protein with PEP-CTERM sorting signal n=1 Tax=Roseateles asaccharophilus TaxID=582607 RepID=A0A4R6N9U4_9BURK|nr:FxDxF family PEP-CTERM protein [Roseateles asaccharophilus]MDN3543434.1 FxDxF family PEP-CTERM protein [Roseateles asaccharophilus]TDP12188.1 putative secreted protein with PEP-CTERM sorting signal [Roseateles asaccharophilus]
MNLKSVVIAAALAVSGVGAWAAGGPVSPSPSASFSNTVTGAFTDIWTFDLGTESAVAASITNVQVSFASLSTGGILGFSAWLNDKLLVGPTSEVTNNGVTVTTKVVAGGSILPAGTYQLKVTGTGITGASASYGGNIVATPITTPIPEPETYAMLLAGLGVVGFVARRRKQQA